jgi:hypothetical protein
MQLLILFHHSYHISSSSSGIFSHDELYCTRGSEYFVRSRLLSTLEVELDIMMITWRSFECSIIIIEKMSNWLFVSLLTHVDRIAVNHLWWYGYNYNQTKTLSLCISTTINNHKKRIIGIDWLVWHSHSDFCVDYVDYVDYVDTIERERSRGWWSI